jgi:glycosyltransferase involved in cell wall biosynthesis
LALDDAARRRMGGQAHQSILASYTWDRVAQRLLDIYLEV